ncbi:MAG: DUF72 domain-containing protein [Candidatus Omnitrophica bacterium]|nr:DUF72 domain-containing protein [Candidatus Omnitrophota bacterium]
MGKKGRIHIGTSGWHYDHWKDVFYPEGLSSGDMLDFYSGKFRTAEINNSFYKLPSKKTFKGWKKQVPEEFIFSVKASRYITHMKKLKCGKRPVNRLIRSVNELGGKLGPVLFQLPPVWGKNCQRLEQFLSILPRGMRYTFEFRNSDWFSEDVYSVLREKNAAFCIYELDKKISPKKVTADFVYVRLHGPDGPYKGKYSKRSLSGWAGAFSTWLNKGLDVYCYFDNDQKGYAAFNALELKKMME